LELLIRQSIPEGIDLPSSQLPCRLDKPVYSASSKSYANVLKQQFSLVSNMTTSAVDNTALLINGKQPSLIMIQILQQMLLLLPQSTIAMAVIKAP